MSAHPDSGSQDELKIVQLIKSELYFFDLFTLFTDSRSIRDDLTILRHDHSLFELHLRLQFLLDFIFLFHEDEI